MNSITNVSRRNFFKVSVSGAAGLYLGFALPEKSKLNAQFAGGVTTGPPPIKPNAYVRIGSDDSVTFIITKSEMGQGPMTALAMILAEELDCDWAKVRTEFAPVDPSLYGPLQGVVGSQSVRTLWTPLRAVGATARAMLVQTAATQWGVDAAQCKTDRGFVVNPAGDARLSYGSLAETASKLPIPQGVKPKDPKTFRLIGTSPKRLDTRLKVTGQAKFGMDARLDGMVYCVVERCPVFGGKVVSFDATKAKAVPGVKDVIQISNGVAVIAANTWSAMQGRKVLEVKWDEGAGASFDSAGISRLMEEKTRQPGVSARKVGDAAATLAAATKKIEAVYEAPFLSHAPMEPMNCTASVTADSCEIWASTQMQTPTRDIAGQITGLPPEKCKVNTMFVGGGFGRRARVDFVQEAVEVSKAMRAPAKVVWSREDDMQHDYYRPAAYTKLAASLGADGWPTAFSADIASQPFPVVVNGLARTAVEGFEDLRYDIPNIQVDYHRVDTHVPVSFWRSVGMSQNGFFLESFIDELAFEAGKDPVEFRRHLLAKNPRMLGVLNLAAEKAEWGKPLPAGRYHGVAVINNVGSYNAQVAEISIGDHGLRVHKVTCAVDCGYNVNPAISQQQIEGGIVYGLTAALKGAITIDKGRVQQANFNTYDVIRTDEMPVVEVHMIRSTEAPGGLGEASVPAIAPAVANAIFAATKKRLRTLPIRPANYA